MRDEAEKRYIEIIRGKTGEERLKTAMDLYIKIIAILKIFRTAKIIILRYVKIKILCKNIMALSIYHKEYSGYTDEEIEKRADAKKQELVAIFQEVPFDSDSDLVRVAVLGCGDKRFVKLHKEIFKSFIEKPIDIITFDITIEHLGGEENVVQHGCTLPLPNGPFDITYAHVLLKFIETEKQWQIIKNSYEALKHGGLAIHILDKEDYETVPLEEYKRKIDEENIKYKEIPVRYGIALVILK